MKSIFSSRIGFVMMIITAIACFTIPVIGQAVEPWTPPAVDTWFNNFNSVYGVVIVIGGYLTRIIPGINLVPGVYRVLAFAILTGAGFFLYGADIWSLALTYFISTSMYEIILKPFNPKPKVTK